MQSATLLEVSVHSDSTLLLRLTALCLDKAMQENTAPFKKKKKDKKQTEKSKTLYRPGNKVLTRVAFYIQHQQHRPA